jgi:Zn-dependent peptidase ImmA (M78 family)
MHAFVGDSMGLQVNHKDGNKDNNALVNLEYCTSSENLLHASRVLGTRRGEALGIGKIKESDIKPIREDKRILREIAAEYGVSLQAIHHIKRKRSWGWV